MPLLIRDYNPGLPDALIRLGFLASQSQSLIDRLVERLVDQAVRVTVPGECGDRL